MTPAARVAAAITILDAILAGHTAEKALSDWARGSRFAGSKDRAALRDLVFDALRKQASSAVIGGALTGRGVMIGSLVQDGIAPSALFTGEGHAPPVLTDTETAHLDSPASLAPHEAVDLPAWLWPIWQADLGDQAMSTAMTLRDRAPLFLRVNRRRGTVEDAIQSLGDDSIEVAVHNTQASCLRVLSNPRRVKLSAAFEAGIVEIQDAASQMAVAALDIPPGAAVLDYCAGGGGKALAIADMYDCDITAHDVATQRTNDIGPRAERAGVAIDVLTTAQLAPDYDVVVADAPCSGSGTWRRNPEAKWGFTTDKLREFSALQGDVLLSASRLVRPGGTLFYMTCSVLSDENERVVQRFVDTNDAWTFQRILQLHPTDSSDGFYLCKLAKTS